MQLLLDPSTSRHRRCLSLNDAPHHVYEKENYIEPLERIHLTLKNGSHNKKKYGNCLGMPLEQAKGHASGQQQRIGPFELGREPRDLDEKNSAGPIQGTGFRSTKTGTLAQRLSSSSNNELFDPISHSRPAEPVEEAALPQGLVQDDMVNQKTSLIQAVFRGYMARSKVRQMWLQRKLVEIQRKKQNELESIEVRKQDELRKIQSRFVNHQSRSGASFKARTGVVTQLILKTHRGRDKNLKMEQRLQSLRKENKRLAIANTEYLRDCKQKELQLNRADWCSLRLIEVIKIYRDAARRGKKMLKDLDARSIADIKATTQGESDRVREIKRMFRIAKDEDLLLL